jgi:hypothetical protein
MACALVAHVNSLHTARVLFTEAGLRQFQRNFVVGKNYRLQDIQL